MSWAFEKGTINASLGGVEGVSAFIQTLKSFMTGVGWSVAEDRTDQPGDAAGSTKLAMKSNGEEGGYPTYFMVITSGTTAATNTNLTCFQMATAYSVGDHDVPASGVMSNTLRARVTLNTRNQEDFQYWFSGDSESLAVVTLQPPSTKDSILIGRMHSFMPVTENAFPLYVIGASNSAMYTDTTTYIRGVGGEPPQTFAGPGENGSEMESLAPLLGSNNQPYNVGSATSIWYAAPLVITYDDNSPERRGLAGTVGNAWHGAGTTTGLVWESKLTASGTSGVQTYRAFPFSTLDSLIIRET